CPWYRAMPPMNKEIPMRKRTLLTALSLVALAAVVAATATAAATGKSASRKADSPVQVEVFAPRNGDVAGKQSKGFFVDLALRYPSLAASGADFQLTETDDTPEPGPLPRQLRTRRRREGSGSDR